MSLNIPSDERVEDAIFVVMYGNRAVESQRLLADLVRKELNKGLERFNISDERIRKIAINRDLVNVTISYNEAKGEMPSECPVCGNKIIEVKNSTLDGDTAVISRRCTKCPYSIGQVKRVPGKYVFTRRRKTR